MTLPAHLRSRAVLAAKWRQEGFHTGRLLSEELRRGVERSPHTRLIIDSDGKLTTTTIGDAHAQSVVLASILVAAGFRAGDVIVVQLPNCLENVLIYLAALQLGVVIVPVVPIYGSAELGFILRQSRARALFVPGRWRSIDMAARIAALGDVPDLERIVVVGDAVISGPVTYWHDLLRGPQAPVPPLQSAPDDVCLVNYTSGTTSAPKGVMHSHHTLGCEVFGFPGVIDLPGDNSPLFNVAPAGHIGGVIMTLRPFLCGENFIYMNTWDVERAVDLIRTHAVSRVGGVPLHWSTLLDHGGMADTVRAGNTGGAGVPPGLIERADARGIRITRAYGSTEHPTVSGGHIDDPLRRRAYTDGRVLPGCAVRIFDDKGRELPHGEPGEITSMGPELFLGYVDASLNADAFTSDGWYRSGDIGVLDEDGFLTVVDRKKDIIIRGGENISSQEVEGILSRHPAIAEAVAVAWPDDIYGERVGVFVRLRAAASIDMSEIQAHFAAQGVARQKTPERLVIVDDFPRTAMGKVIKPELRKHIAGLLKAQPDTASARK